MLRKSVPEVGFPHRLRADGGIRTHDQLITNQLLWPTELHRQIDRLDCKSRHKKFTEQIIPDKFSTFSHSQRTPILPFRSGVKSGAKIGKVLNNTTACTKNIMPEAEASRNPASIADRSATIPIYIANAPHSGAIPRVCIPGPHPAPPLPRCGPPPLPCRPAPHTAPQTPRILPNASRPSVAARPGAAVRRGHPVRRSRAADCAGAANERAPAGIIPAGARSLPHRTGRAGRRWTRMRRQNGRSSTSAAGDEA